MRRVLLPVSCLLLGLVSGAGCGGSEGDGGMLGQSGTLSGQWQMTVTHDFDNCGPGSVDPPETLALNLSDGGSQLTLEVSGGVCSQAPVFALSGSTATYSSTTVDTSGGCTLRNTTATTLTFGTDTFTGETNFTTEYVSGFCGPGPFPCTARDTLSGQRCSGCFAGCS